jgi:RNA polymerase sigma-70 factor (ECF subfamily)
MGLVITEVDLADYMRTLGPGLLAVARGICRDTGAAEDVVQEAFVRLWKSPPDGPKQVVPSWLRRVVINLSINQIRRNKRVEELPEWSVDPAMQHRSQSPGEKVEMDDSLRQINDAMATLPPEKRAVLILRVHQRLSYEEIARVMDVPVGTVMSRLNRARTALRNALEAQQSDDRDDSYVIPFHGSSTARKRSCM